jgi:hypothetical protein
MRVLAASGVFVLDPHDRFSLNEISDTLRTVSAQSVRDYVLMYHDQDHGGDFETGLAFRCLDTKGAAMHKREISPAQTAIQVAFGFINARALYVAAKLGVATLRYINTWRYCLCGGQ